MIKSKRPNLRTPALRALARITGIDFDAADEESLVKRWLESWDKN
ncbi:hypothetical protein E3J62_00220 [candidate division TA06 bacterium]|uniref:Uncharacterized protein n=1 Tax=candidate division TA06 bacterium TaxID=2250710 RepID=A0A523UZ61_UNCT6|nr:MAG: hypothetical protein E3J62_00220 [candidate division TA06 bacterium]